ncbi:glycoside hydrolase family 3 C-terminal domain-containing protein [Actinotalea sp. M2MS4P-6]|uniref:beta-glucosidase n=1 Tax=Actinotalea sp. M2MS4P-6 TaxID=2983762 RepID=UPI0021E4471E|nr:glycoside hydrolase family 3 C-terminal domain-containing protein [Actinotalea sp. M2MS4P-6]MCV2394203.1 glycoside hydrolase family 3 C-terminal domain-containing protein [Actinotalea sp. M2MS4P-6]
MRTNTRSLRRAALVGAAIGLVAPGIVVAGSATADEPLDCSTVAWMDTSKTPAERAAALLEVSSQYQTYRWLVEQPATQPTTTSFRGVEYPVQVECTPEITYTDGPDGVRTSGTTAWPAPLAIAATWDTDLAYDKGDAMGEESFLKGRNMILAPGVASGRTPLSGRTPEYLGEDSLLSGLMAAAGVNGIQADGTVLGELKHYVANEQETARTTSSSNIDERTLREVYELPFEIALQRSDPGSIMCSYNQINGTYACENAETLGALKDDLGLDAGFVVSDFGAVHTTAASLNAGMDQELNRPRYFTPALLDEALAAGEITQERIDEAAMRVISAYIAGGLFDNPKPVATTDSVSTEAHKALAYQAGLESSVLLKNDGILPLDTSGVGSIALIGPTASSTVTDGISASSVCSMSGFRGGSLTCEDLVSAETAMTARAAQDGISVAWNDGADLTAAADAAAAADVAVVFGYQRMGEFSDIPDLHLQGGGDALVEAVAAANPNTVVVLQTGSAVEMPWIDGVDAVLENWYGGEVQGPVIASLLFGDESPSGKLPMTFPVSLADTPTAGSVEQFPGVADASGILQVDYSEGLEVGYHWYEAQGIEPLFPFGYGLTYSTFRYSHLQVTPTSTDGDHAVRISFRLTNTGDVTATEVAQAYVELPAAADEPSKRLVGWERVTLRPHQHKNVTITLTRDDLRDLHLLQYYDTEDGAWTTANGVYTVTVGGSIDTTLTDTFRIHHASRHHHTAR